MRTGRILRVSSSDLDAILTLLEDQDTEEKVKGLLPTTPDFWGANIFMSFSLFWFEISAFPRSEFWRIKWLKTSSFHLQVGF